MQQRRHVAALLSAAIIAQDDTYPTRALCLNSISPHEFWNMHHWDESNEIYHQDAMNQYADTYMALQARKRLQAPMQSMSAFPLRHTTMIMLHHSTSPMGQFHARMPRPLQPSFYTPSDEYLPTRHLSVAHCTRVRQLRPFAPPSWNHTAAACSGMIRSPRFALRAMTQGLPAIFASQSDDSVLSLHQVFLRLQIEILNGRHNDTHAGSQQADSIAPRGHSVPVLHTTSTGPRLLPRDTVGSVPSGSKHEHQSYAMWSVSPHARRGQTTLADLIPSINTNSGCGRTYWTERLADSLVSSMPTMVSVGRDQNDV